MGCRLQRRVIARRSTRGGSSLPALLPDTDPQAIRVMALLAPVSEHRAWRRQLKLAPAGRRASAVVALGTVLGARSTLLLARVLAGDSDAHVRRMAAETLGFCSGTAPLRVLLRHAGTEDAEVRAAVLRALGRLGRGNAQVHSCLEAALQSPHAVVCEAALLAMGQSHHPRCVEAAVSLASHPGACVRKAALTLLDGVAIAHDVLSQAAQDADATVVSLAQAALERVCVG